MVDFPAALQEAQVWMDEIPGVQAVAECESAGEKCIYVYVTVPDAAARLPAEFKGYRVIVEQGDPMQAQELDTDDR